MTIAIDTSPLSDANSVRGVGFYTKRLVSALQQYAPQHQYILNTHPLQALAPGIDIVHYPYFDPFYLTLPARGQHPTVVTIHDCIPLQFPELFPKGIKGWLKLQLQTHKLSKVDAVITDSDYSRQDIQKFYGLSVHKIHVTPLAVEEYFQRVTEKQTLSAIKAKYQLPDEFLIKVGDINPTKNFSTTLHAIAQLPDVHLVLVGKALVADRDNKPILPELQAILNDIQKLKLTDRVHRLGFVPDEDMPSLYTLAKATLQNSLYEGFGLPALESISCGTSVIAGNNSSLPEILGTTGRLINATSVEETVLAIKYFYTASADDYVQHIHNSIQQSQKFSLFNLARDTIKVYECLI